MGNYQPLKAAERRAAERRSALDDYLCLVDLGDNRSAMLLDVSETGIGVQAVEGPGEGFTTKFRFQLPDTAVLVEGEGEIAWADRAGRMGVRFTKLAPELLPELRKWVASEANPLFAHQPVTDEIADLDARDRIAQLEARIIVSGWAQIQALNFLVDQISAMTQASGVAIAVEDGGGIVCKASSGTAPQVGVRVNPRSGLSWECVRTREVVTCVDTENDPRVDRLVCRQLNMRSAMLVPVMKDSRIAGLVEVFSSRPHAFNNQSVILLRRVAEAVAGLDETASGVASEPEVHSSATLDATPRPVEAARISAIPAVPPVAAVPARPAPRPVEAASQPLVPPVTAAPAPPIATAPKPFIPTLAPVPPVSVGPKPFVPTPAPPPMAAPVPNVFVPPLTASPTQQVAPTVAPPVARPSSATAVTPAARVPAPPASVRTAMSSVPVVAGAAAPPPTAMPAAPVPTATQVARPATLPAQEVATIAQAPSISPTRAAQTVAVTAPAVTKVEKAPTARESSEPVAQRVESPFAPPRTEKPLADKPRAVMPMSIAYQDAPLPEVAFSGAAAAARRAAAIEAVAQKSSDSADALEVAALTTPAAEPDRRKLYIGGAVAVFLALSAVGGWYVAHSSAKPAAVITPPTVNAANPTNPTNATESAAVLPALTPAVTPAALASNATAAVTPNPLPASASSNAAPKKPSPPSQPSSNAEPEVIIRQAPAATFVAPRANSAMAEATTAPSIAIAPPNTAGMASLLSAPVAVPNLGRPAVSQGVTGGKQLTHVQPVYPAAARAMHLSGMVTIKLHVAKNGMVSRAEVVSGHPLLNAAALEAVKRWRYQPFMLNGEPIDNDVSVQVRFELPR